MVYSFLSVTCAMAGLGGAFTLSGEVAEEGITLEPNEDKVTFTPGLYGDGMLNLIGSNAMKATIRLLKTNPLNALLQNMYNLQNSHPVGVGTNVISIRDTNRGDIITLAQAAFTGQPSITYSKEGGIMEWNFIAVKAVPILGTGTPEA